MTDLDRAALDAPPAGLREGDDLRLRWLRTFHDATSGLCNDDPCHVAWLIDLLDAAPSCGHPIDAERLARALASIHIPETYEEWLEDLSRTIESDAQAIAAAYDGEEKS